MTYAEPSRLLGTPPLCPALPTDMLPLSIRRDGYTYNVVREFILPMLAGIVPLSRLTLRYLTPQIVLGGGMVAE